MSVASAVMACAACGGRDDSIALDAGWVDDSSFACPEGTTLCGDHCVELEYDPDHCGACDLSCPSGTACVNAGCQPLAEDEASSAAGVADGGATGAGETATNDATVPVDAEANPCTPCDGGCVDTDTDSRNCGGCGVACSPRDVCTAGLCVSSTSNWGMFGHDEQHTGNNPDEMGVPPAVSQWAFNVEGDGGGDGALSPAVVENGRAFVTTDTSFADYAPLAAVDVSDGSPLWTYNFGRIDAAGQPSVVNGAVYVQTVGSSENCYLWAFDAVSSSVKWTASFASQWAYFWAPTVHGDSIYANGGEYGGLYGFRVADGSQIFFDDTIGQYDSWSPAYFNGKVYSFVDGTFRASDPSTGAAAWSTSINWNWTGYSMNTSPVFGPQLSYVVAPPNLVAVDPSAQKIAWSVNGSFTGTPAVADGVVYATNGGSLVARDATTGSLLWTFVGDQGLSYPPAVANGYVYVSSMSNVYAVSIATQAQVWTAPAGGWVTVAAGRLLVAGPDGVLRGFVLSTP